MEPSLAYIATGSSAIGGFFHFGNLLLRDETGHGTSAVSLSILVTAISIWIAWRDVKISARPMLWIEAVSVSFILVVVILVPDNPGRAEFVNLADVMITWDMRFFPLLPFPMVHTGYSSSGLCGGGSSDSSFSPLCALCFSALSSPPPRLLLTIHLLFSPLATLHSPLSPLESLRTPPI